jgi:hypothetical protein
MQNKQLTKNISLKECLEGVVMPKEAIDMAWKHLNRDIENNLQLIAEAVQEDRDYVNRRFKSDLNDKEISVIITAGFRPKEWEWLQDRSGDGQHPLGTALDYCFGNVSLKLAQELTRAVYRKNEKEKWMGGLAIKKPSEITTGIVHKDNRTPSEKHIRRGFGARWEY